MRIIVDTNLLLLLVVGSTDRSLIAKHKRLASYTADDFDLLVGILTQAQSVIVTPNTLTETSNLARYINDPARTIILAMFRQIIENPLSVERSVGSAAVSKSDFLRLGLTDAVLLHLAAESHTLLTADLELYLAARQRGLSVENFNHYRNL